MTVGVEEREGATGDGRAITVQRLGAGESEAAERQRWRRRAAAALVVAVAAVGLLAWQAGRPAAEVTGVTGVEAAAETRDRVVIAASEAVEVLNVLDHRDVGSGLAAWETVTTGALHEEIAAMGAEQVDALAEAGAVSRARVVEAAVLDLDVESGSAQVVAFTEVTVAPRSGRASVRRYRYVVDLARVDGRWLVEAMSLMEPGQ